MKYSNSGNNDILVTSSTEDTTHRMQMSKSRIADWVEPVHPDITKKAVGSSETISDDTASNSSNKGYSNEDLVMMGYEGNNKINDADVTNKKQLFKTIQTLEDTDADDNELLHLLWANGVYRKYDFDDFNKFYIFPRRDPYKIIGSAREYVFITRPDLHIFGSTAENPYNTKAKREDPSNLNPELQGVPFFKDLFDRGYQELLASLNFSHDPTAPFVNILSNYKTSNLELTNINVGDEETAANIYNTRIFYRKPSDSADEDADASIEFRDNKYLDCYLWFKAYDIYERLKYQGKVTPYNWNYTMYKSLSDQMTIFKFIVGEDGETIIHWAQLWGCYPKSVPRAIFSEMPEDGIYKFTVDWRVTFQDDLNPLTILHFNRLTDLYRRAHQGATTLPLDDAISGRVTGEAAGFPYIVKIANPMLPHKVYQLKWLKAMGPNTDAI